MPTATSLGSASAATSGTTLALTVTANVAVGETIFVAHGLEFNAGETGAITDSGGNTYTKDVEHTHSVGIPIGGLSRAVCATGLTSGSSTITVTSSGSVNERLIAAFKLAAGDVQNPIVTDGSNSNEGSSTSATPGSVTPTFIPDLGTYLVVGSGAALRTGTPPANWTEMFDFGNAGVGKIGMQFNRLTANTSTLTALNGTETISATEDWVCMQVLYKVPVVSAGAHIVVVDSAVAQSTSR